MTERWGVAFDHALDREPVMFMCGISFDAETGEAQVRAVDLSLPGLQTFDVPAHQIVSGTFRVHHDDHERLPPPVLSTDSGQEAQRLADMLNTGARTRDVADLVYQIKRGHLEPPRRVLLVPTGKRMVRV